MDAGGGADEPVSGADSGSPHPVSPAWRGWRDSVLLAHVVRTATIVAFLVVAFLAVRLVTAGDDKPFYEHPTFRNDELPVFNALALETGDPVVIRGFVFEGPGARELRLCNARTRDDPPGCLGPFLSLEGVDRGSFAMEEGRTDEGGVLYSPDSVALRGTLIGSLMKVELVLGDG